MQRYASAALKDGLDTETLRDLASLASWGVHGGNVERDFHRMIPHLYDTKLPLHAVCVECKDPDTGKIVSRELPLLLPTDVLAAIWKKQSPDLWDTLIGVDSEGAAAFWQNFKRCNPACSHHPVFESIGPQLKAF